MSLYPERNRQRLIFLADSFLAWLAVAGFAGFTLILGSRLASHPGLNVDILFWVAVLWLFWRKKNLRSRESRLQFSSFLGLVLLGLALHKGLALFWFEPFSLRVLTGLGFGVILVTTRGLQGLRLHGRELGIIAFLIIPLGQLQLNQFFPIEQLTAAIAAFGLHYLGFTVEQQGELLVLPTGTVAVVYWCSGGPLIVLMLRLVVLLVLTFALEWLPGLLAAVSAMGLGFVIGVVRVAMLALMLDQPSTFAYWHGETGSGFFSGVTLLLLGGLCYALLDGDRNLPDDALDSQSVSPSSSRGLITTLPGAIAAMATVCAAGLAIFNPAIGRRSVSPFQFPHAIRLPPYQFLGSQALKNKPVGVDFVLAARRYHYAIAETPFTIEMRYLIGTRGNVAGNLGNLWHPLEFPKIHFPILREHQNPEVGSYGVLEKDGQTHLNACITPSGRSTLTPKQFLGDRTEAQASLPDLLAVINGQTPWRDQRCLWVLLSTPTVPDAHTTELKLEALWLAWYHHWQDQFPPL